MPPPAAPTGTAFPGPTDTPPPPIPREPPIGGEPPSDGHRGQLLGSRRVHYEPRLARHHCVRHMGESVHLAGLERLQARPQLLDRSHVALDDLDAKLTCCLPDRF